MSHFSCQQHLENLGPLLRAVARLLEASPLGARVGPEVLEGAVTGECVQCGICVSGKDLLESARENECESSAKVRRLRQGYCARNGCNSYYYRLSFAPTPGVNWPEILTQVDVFPGPEADCAERVGTGRSLLKLAGWRGLVAGCLVITAIGTIWLTRQWYLGGRIPFVREPEHFQVDHMATEAAER